MKCKIRFTISTALIVIFSVLLTLSCGATASASETPETLDEKTFKELWDQFFFASFDLYDINSGQIIYPTVLFGYDSNGVPYAGGKCYYYINYGDRDLSGCYASALENFKKCLTPELAERMVENFHVPGGPDVELIRRGSDGNWYRLFLIRPFGFVYDIYSIEPDGINARVTFNSSVILIDLSRHDLNEYPFSKYVRMDFTVDLVYTEDGWRISGGDAFDFIRDYAATSPETGDSDGTRAEILAATAAVAAVIPAVILTVSRRRRRVS